MAEFDIIERLIARAPAAGADVTVGPGDDGAVLALPAGHELVLTTDTLVAGVHFPVDTAAADVGWKALAVNLSDLAAMGAQAAWITVALTVPEADPEAWLAGFMDGMAPLLADSGAALVGGDLTRGPLTVTLQAAGTLPAGTAVTRARAQPGDSIAVTGTLGDAALALTRWSGASSPANDAECWLRERLTRPQPRLATGIALRERAHAAIDISDGLRADLGHIADASGVAAVVEAARLPVSAAFAALCPPDQALPYQLAGGDDYELCVCGPEAAIAEVTGLTVIGLIEAGAGVRVIDTNGDSVEAGVTGYDHFNR